MDATTNQGDLAVTPTSVTLLAEQNGPLPAPVQLTVEELCGDMTWQVSDDAAWLTTSVNGQSVMVQVDTSGLANGSYTGTVTVTAVGVSNSDPIHVTVQLIVTDEVFRTYLPMIEK